MGYLANVAMVRYGIHMSTVIEIERAIESLKPEEFRELLGWMEQKERAIAEPRTPAPLAWPDFAARQLAVFGEDFELPARFVDELINGDRGE
jgi:hypothetical protein